MKLFMNVVMAWAVCFSLPVAGCHAADGIVPSSKYETKKLAIGNVSAVEATSSVDLVYTQSEGEAYAEVYAPENILPYIEVKEKGGKLTVGYSTPLSIRGKAICEVRVSAPEITSFDTSCSSDIYIEKGLSTTRNVSMRAESSGDIIAKASVECGDLSLAASSSGDIVMKSSVRCVGLQVSASSSGDVLAQKVTCGNMSLCAESSSDVKIGDAVCQQAAFSAESGAECRVERLACKGDVRADASSAGEIRLSGTCRNATYKARQGSSVHAGQLKATDVSADARMGAEIYCHAEGNLSASRSLGGEVRNKK